MQRIDPGEQRLVEVDLVPVAGEARRHVALDRLDRVVRVGARQHIEDIADTAEQPPRPLQRRHSVVEIRLGAAARDGGDLAAVLGQRLLEGGREVVGLDRRERRHAERRGPAGEQRVVLAHCAGTPCPYLMGH